MKGCCCSCCCCSCVVVSRVVVVVAVQIFKKFPVIQPDTRATLTLLKIKQVRVAFIREREEYDDKDSLHANRRPTDCSMSSLYDA